MNAFAGDATAQCLAVARGHARALLLGTRYVGSEDLVDVGNGKEASTRMLPTIVKSVVASFGNPRGDKATLPQMPKPVRTIAGDSGIPVATFNSSVTPAAEAYMLFLSLMHVGEYVGNWQSPVNPGAIAVMSGPSDYLNDDGINSSIHGAFQLALDQAKVLQGSEEDAAPFVAAKDTLAEALVKKGYRSSFHMNPHKDDAGDFAILPVNNTGDMYKLLYVWVMVRRHDSVQNDPDGHANQVLDKFTDRPAEAGVAGGDPDAAMAPSSAVVAAAVTVAVEPLKAQIQQQQEQLSQIRALLEQLAAQVPVGGPAAAGGGGV